MNLARQPVAFFERAQLGAGGKEAGALNGNTQHVTHGIEQAQIIGRKLTPIRAGHVEHPQRFAVCIDRDAGMITQTVGAVDQFIEPATGDYIDIGRARQITFMKAVQAITGTLHALWILG